MPRGIKGRRVLKGNLALVAAMQSFNYVIGSRMKSCGGVGVGNLQEGGKGIPKGRGEL